MKHNTLPPAELWLGPQQQLITHAQHYTQKIFCKYNACTTCKICSLIKDQQYHSIIWLCPEKFYTISSLEPITKTVSFALEKNQHFFFIIQKADFLPPLCQNMLLKTIEEPPIGYHFLFLAERKEYILPTIQSRCRIKTWYTHTFSNDIQPLIHFFTEKALNPLTCIDKLAKHNPNERESIELLDTIISYWLAQYEKTINTCNKNHKNIQKKLRLLMKAQQQPPMPGSSKLFWKNLFLQWQE